MTIEFRAGLHVRLKSNPTRAGVLTGESTGSSAMPRWQVIFPDRTEAVPALALEAIPADGGDPFDDMHRLRFAKPHELRSAITHARLSGKLSDLIYSLYTTNTDFYAYQFKPVLSFLDSPSRGILIADEVGLGKTIEAGLIWTELRSREDARRLLVLCPAMLREKWRLELSERFGVNALICSTEETVGRLEQAVGNARSEFAIIASMQGLRSLAEDPEDDDETSLPARFRMLADESAGGESPLDLVIIDEAHYLRNAETQTARLGHLLRRITENIVLLSATPVHLRNTDLFNLLNLLDPDSFAYEWSFDSALEQNAPLVHVRDLLLRAETPVDEIHRSIEELRSSDLFGRSESLRFLVETGLDVDAVLSVGQRLSLAERIDRVNPITKVVIRTRKRDVHERRVIREPLALRAEMTPVEREFYTQVTDAVREYCTSMNLAEGFLLTIPQRQMCSSMAAACRSWTTRSDALSDEIDELLWDAFGNDGSGQKRANSKGLIGQLSKIARDVGDFSALRRDDSKFTKLREQLQEYWTRFPGAKVVLFAYFRDTLRYLEERFREIGVDSVVLMGGMDKQAGLEQFRSDSGPRLLLASEVASEGIDLQFSSLLVNYDLPWNPMRVEQRIGRIDRIGQKAERIVILNLFLGETLDERVYVRLFERLRIFERALGSIEGILGEMVREMSFELLRHHLSSDEEVKVIEQTLFAVEKKVRIESELEDQAGRLVAHGDYLQHRVALARDLNRYVTSDDLHAYVGDFIEEHCEGAQLVMTRSGDPPVWELDLGPRTRAEFGEFLEHERQQGRTRLATAASGRHSVVFKNVLGPSKAGTEVISQYHPLVGYIARYLTKKGLHRNAVLSAMSLRVDALPAIRPGIFIFAVSRWSLVGERTQERLAFEACRLGELVTIDPAEAERMVTTAAMQGREWLAASGELDGEVVRMGFENAIDTLDLRYRDYMENAARENRDRVAFQKHQVDQQEERDLARIQDMIGRMRAAGKTRTIRANEGRIKKARERATERRARLDRRMDLRHESTLVCAGVIRII
jgi:superfamily II DNA or RNA helicase